MNLIFDIGNSRTKTAVFDNGVMLERYVSEEYPARVAKALIKEFPGADSAIISTTRKDDNALEDTLKEHSIRTFRFDHATRVPLQNLYATPLTLGRDRLAAAVAANYLYPGRNVLVIDLGTAVTFDVVTAAGEYLGGNISPGAGMRLRALHDQTGRLPLHRLPEDGFRVTANTTEDALRSGVAAGIVFEIEGYIERISAQYDDLCIIFTGGDADFFAKQLKNPIFANYDLVVIGLNRILEYNAE